jgi:hypothetical protein
MSLFNELHRICTGIGCSAGTPTGMFKPLAAQENFVGDASDETAMLAAIPERATIVRFIVRATGAAAASMTQAAIRAAGIRAPHSQSIQPVRTPHLNENVALAVCDGFLEGAQSREPRVEVQSTSSEFKPV